MLEFLLRFWYLWLLILVLLILLGLKTMLKGILGEKHIARFQIEIERVFEEEDRLRHKRPFSIVLWIM